MATPNNPQFPEKKTKDYVISDAMRRALSARGIESAEEQLEYMKSVNDRFKGTNFREGN